MTCFTIWGHWDCIYIGGSRCGSYHESSGIASWSCPKHYGRWFSSAFVPHGGIGSPHKWAKHSSPCGTASSPCYAGARFFNWKEINKLKKFPPKSLKTQMLNLNFFNSKSFSSKTRQCGLDKRGCFWVWEFHWLHLKPPSLCMVWLVCGTDIGFCSFEW